MYAASASSTPRTGREDTDGCMLPLPGGSPRLVRVKLGDAKSTSTVNVLLRTSAAVNVDAAL